MIIVKLILICSALCMGVTIATQEEMILSFLGRYDAKWTKPLWSCIWCMPSIWSIVAMFIACKLGFFEFGEKAIWMYPVVVSGASVINGVTWNIIELLIKKNE